MVQLKVSSVLNRDVKNYGKQYLMDGNDETCWNSNQGLPQWIQLDYPSLISLHEIQIMFQGGFAASQMELQIKSTNGNNENGLDEKEWETIHTFYPQDKNNLQEFILPNAIHVQQFRLLFSKSFDFFGRIIVYKLDCL